jgi:hypothetical protein
MLFKVVSGPPLEIPVLLAEIVPVLLKVVSGPALEIPVVPAEIVPVLLKAVSEPALEIPVVLPEIVPVLFKAVSEPEIWIPVLTDEIVPALFNVPLVDVIRIASTPTTVTPFGTVMVKLLSLIDKSSQLPLGLVFAVQVTATASDIPRLKYPMINSKLTHRSSTAISGLFDVVC